MSTQDRLPETNADADAVPHDATAGDVPTELDLRGLNCPMPVLRTAKALRPLIFGARISVLASDPLARIDIPHFCREHGHVLEECDTTGEALRFVIRKGMGPETGS